MNREGIIIMVCIAIVLFLYLIQDKTAPAKQKSLSKESDRSAIIQDIVKQGTLTEEQLKQTLEKAFNTMPDSL
jgi:uncharacterized membrane protein